jgi:hypothetical protein
MLAHAVLAADLLLPHPQLALPLTLVQLVLLPLVMMQAVTAVYHPMDVPMLLLAPMLNYKIAKPSILA